MTISTSGSDTEREAAFLSALLADHEDHATRLVYADWLEERGDGRGEFIHLGYALDDPSRHRDWRRMRARRDSLRPHITVRWQILIGWPIRGESFVGVVTWLDGRLAGVDLNGLEGVIDVAELSSWNFPLWADFNPVGAKVDVLVTAVNFREGRVRLFPALWDGRLWDEVFDRYPVGSRHTRPVRSVAHFGLFVELEPSLEGLVYIPEAARMRPPRRLRELFEKGEVVEVLVLDIDWHRKQIALAIVDSRSGTVCWGVVPP